LEEHVSKLKDDDEWKTYEESKNEKSKSLFAKTDLLLKEENKKNIRQKISDELSQADARGDRQKVDELLERLNKLN